LCNAFFVWFLLLLIEQDRAEAIKLLVTMHNVGEISLERRRFGRLAKQEVGMVLL
jgi:hypothetical protein